MKILNFTAVEILPSLLNKTKAQTIRPAIIEKPARFKVGEQITLMWNQRSPHKYFRKSDGKSIPLNKFKEGMYELLDDNLFSKIIGMGKITEVFKIEIGRDTDGLKLYWVKIDKILQQLDFVENLAKRDGFKTSGHMFKWFDEHYNLITPKPLWVYRWRWI